VGQVFFGYFAAVIALTAILVVALKNPIYSALSLLVMFFHVAGLYVTLHAEFLAAVQVIVYAGAILVLYLFVVMLLNVKRAGRVLLPRRPAGEKDASCRRTIRWPSAKSCSRPISFRSKWPPWCCSWP
jgi:NADH-quinone oxidoreductase subunit J